MHVKPVEKKNRVILVDGDCTTRYEITSSFDLRRRKKEKQERKETCGMNNPEIN